MNCMQSMIYAKTCEFWIKRRCFTYLPRSEWANDIFIHWTLLAQKYKTDNTHFHKYIQTKLHALKLYFGTTGLVIIVTI